MRNDTHGRLARSLLAVAKDLAHERPDHDGGRVDGSAEEIVVSGEHLLDPRGGQRPARTAAPVAIKTPLQSEENRSGAARGNPVCCT